MTREMIRLSRFLSLVLRHDPGCIGLTLNKQGWVEVSDLIANASRCGTDISMSKLIECVETNDKKRFAFNEDKTRIRASQGHSVDIDLGLPPRIPPHTLYHGTTVRFVDRIKNEGLTSQRRRHVHLSKDKATATAVGLRHGDPAVLPVRAGEYHKAGGIFYLSENGVWLTNNVPSKYIDWNRIEFPGSK